MNLIARAKKTLRESNEKKDPVNLSRSFIGCQIELNSEIMTTSHVSPQHLPTNYKQLAPPSPAGYELSRRSMSPPSQELMVDKSPSEREVLTTDGLDEEEGLLEELLNQECDSLLLKLQRRMMASPPKVSTPSRSHSAPENLNSDIPGK